jgi:hypothetical protein
VNLIVSKCMRTLVPALMLAGAQPAVAATSSIFPSQFAARILASHNAARAQVGASPLAWDPMLSNAAAAYAQQMAYTRVFAHSNRKARPGTGENLWMGTRGAFSVETMIGGWTSERRMFAPGIFPAVSRTGNWADVGHYTQMIWPGTQRVGCAVASNASTDYLVCRYSPAGNIDGRPVIRSTFTTALNQR